jgi:lysophospholipase L1-like esterase
MAADITAGVARLVRCVLASDAGPAGKAPRVLLVAPFPLGEGLASSPFAEMLGGRPEIEKSKLLGSRYEALAHALGIAFLDAGTLVKAHPKDSLHLTAEGQRFLGEGIARTIAAEGLLPA